MKRPAALAGDLARAITDVQALDDSDSNERAVFKLIATPKYTCDLHSVRAVYFECEAGNQALLKVFGAFDNLLSFSVSYADIDETLVRRVVSNNQNLMTLSLEGFNQPCTFDLAEAIPSPSNSIVYLSLQNGFNDSVLFCTKPGLLCRLEALKIAFGKHPMDIKHATNMLSCCRSLERFECRRFPMVLFPVLVSEWCPALERLKLNRCEHDSKVVETSGPIAALAHLNQLTRLTDLRLYNCHLRDDDVAQIAKRCSARLIRVDLGSNHMLTQTSLNTISDHKWPKLKRLVLSRSSITDLAPLTTECVPKLNSLNVIETCVSGAALARWLERASDTSTVQGQLAYLAWFCTPSPKWDNDLVQQLLPSVALLQYRNHTEFRLAPELVCQLKKLNQAQLAQQQHLPLIEQLSHARLIPDKLTGRINRAYASYFF
eukprot:TRINITY_DN3133_c0_g1_i2.p1 TRINITY_DN3133_c0_g1~~TRINITY_DN3133_c0_g1_i2.p1  ORF type:complete len:431 (-),score=51.15 TRINITY_DN3133_c0_g1_i2:11-1303(-)